MTIRLFINQLNQLFSLKENIRISQYTVEILDRFENEMAIADRRPKIYYHREGNLFLVDRQNQRAAKKAKTR